jgi:hypothetical protein
MGKKPRSMDSHIVRKFWGLRPWKRHSMILLVAGVLYALIGYQYIIAPPNKTRDDSLVVVLQIAPLWVWGITYLVAGVLVMLSSIWPPFSETWGYMVLAGLSAAWMATYFIGYMFFHAPPSGLSGSLLWGLLAFMWWAISGLLNPDNTAVTSRGNV